MHTDNSEPYGKINRTPPQLDKDTWHKLDSEFMDVNFNSWTKFKGKIVEPEQYIEELNTTLAKFLQSKEEFIYETKTYFKHSNTSTDTIEEIKKQKNMLNKKAKKKDATEKDKLAAIESIRFYNYLVKLKKEKYLTKFN